MRGGQESGGLVLIVEDNRNISEMVGEYLEGRGFEVDYASDGQDGYRLAVENNYDVIVLDLLMPRLDGREVLRQIRRRGLDTRVLVLSALDGVEERVGRLDDGADDYLVKPFHVEELLARLNALLRRAAGWSKPTLECGPVALDLAAQTVSVAGSNVDLTSYEYKVLEYLMMHAGELVSKADLTEHIYQQDFDRDSNVLEVFIGRLRKKLDPDGELKPIETVRGRGYRFAIARTDG